METIEIPQDTELTIEWLQERAVRPADAAYTEAIIRPNSYSSCPLPQDEELGKKYMMAMGGWVRYIFHDGGNVVEVEYITDGGGVRRHLYVGNREFPLVFTYPQYYLAEGSLQELVSDWQRDGHVKDGYVHVVVHHPLDENLPECIVRTIAYGDASGPSDIHEQEFITPEGVRRQVRRGGEVIGSSFTPTAVYVPNEPLRQY